MFCFQRFGEVDLRPGTPRAEPDGFLKFVNRLIKSPAAAERHPKIVMRLQVIRFEPDGYLKLADRRVNLVFAGQSHAKVFMRLGKSRFQPDGLLKLDDCLVEFSFLTQGHTEVVSGEIIVFRDGKIVPEESFAVPPISQLMPRCRQAEDQGQ